MMASLERSVVSKRASPPRGGLQLPHSGRREEIVDVEIPEQMKAEFIGQRRPARWKSRTTLGRRRCTWCALVLAILQVARSRAQIDVGGR